MTAPAAPAVDNHNDNPTAQTIAAMVLQTALLVQTARPC